VSKTSQIVLGELLVVLSIVLALLPKVIVMFFAVEPAPLIAPALGTAGLGFLANGVQNPFFRADRRLIRRRFEA
jgi:hypothetical protein